MVRASSSCWLLMGTEALGTPIAPPAPVPGLDRPAPKDSVASSAGEATSSKGGGVLGGEDVAQLHREVASVRALVHALEDALVAASSERDSCLAFCCEVIRAARAVRFPGGRSGTAEHGLPDDKNISRVEDIPLLSEDAPVEDVLGVARAALAVLQEVGLPDVAAVVGSTSTGADTDPTAPQPSRLPAAPVFSTWVAPRVEAAAPPLAAALAAVSASAKQASALLVAPADTTALDAKACSAVSSLAATVIDCHTAAQTGRSNECSPAELSPRVSPSLSPHCPRSTSPSSKATLSPSDSASVSATNGVAAAARPDLQHLAHAPPEPASLSAAALLPPTAPSTTRSTPPAAPRTGMQQVRAALHRPHTGTPPRRQHGVHVVAPFQCTSASGPLQAVRPLTAPSAATVVGGRAVVVLATASPLRHCRSSPQYWTIASSGGHSKDVPGGSNSGTRHEPSGRLQPATTRR